MKKFLNDLRRELNDRHVKPEDIEEILADHEEMIKTALAEGLSEDDIAKRFGDPAKLADELADTPAAQPVEGASPEGFQPWKAFPADGSRLSVDIRLVDEDIVIQTGDHPDIRILKKGKTKTDDYEVAVEKGTFTLKAPKLTGGLFFGIRRDSDLVFLVEFPKESRLETVKFVTVSGDASFLGLALTDLSADTTSGDLHLRGLGARDVRWNAVSGDVKAEDSVFASLSASAVSGDLAMKNVQVAGNLRIHTVSGDARAEDCTAGETELETVSGDVHGKEFYPETVRMKSVSGDVTLENRERNRIKVLSTKSVSGELIIR